MDDKLDSAEEEKADKADSNGGQEDRFLPSDQRLAETPRRDDDERRQSVESPEAEERREPPDRRKQIDRRTIGLEVICKTTGSITNIEDWLDDHCDSGWQVVLQKIGKNLDIKHLKVMFETEADRDFFLDKYLKIDE